MIFSLKINKKKVNILFVKISFLFFLIFNFLNFLNFVNAYEFNEKETFRKEVIFLVNVERVNQGEKKLKENVVLNKVAQKKLDNMIAENYFSHVSPKGIDPWVWFDEEGYDFEYAGENLAMNFSDVNEQHEAWMSSFTHRKNILNKHFTDTGVAVQEKFVDGKKFFVTVQVFGNPRNAILKSASFTPKTFQVSSNIIYADLNDNFSLSNLSNNSENFKFQNINKFKFLAWIILILIILLVSFMEYKFFVINNK